MSRTAGLIVTALCALLALASIHHMPGTVHAQHRAHVDTVPNPFN